MSAPFINEGGDGKYDPIDTLMKCKSTIRQLNTELEKEKAEHNKLKRENVLVGKELLELKARLAGLENEKEKWQSTSTELTATKEQLGVAKRSLAELQNGQQNAKQATFLQGSTDLQRQLKQATDRITTLEGQKQTLEELKDRLAEDVRYLEGRSSQYELTVNPIVDRQKNAIIQLEDRVQQLETHCAAVEARLQHEREELRAYYENEIMDIREDYERRKDALQQETHADKERHAAEAMSRQKDSNDQIAAVEKLYEKAREEVARVKDELNDKVLAKEKEISDKDLELIGERNRLEHEKQVLRTTLIECEQKLHNMGENMEIRGKLLSAKEMECERLTKEGEVMEKKLGERNEAVEKLGGEKKELGKRVEQLERLDEKRERSSKVVVRQLEAEVLQLKASLEKSETKNADNKQLMFENHKMNLHNRELKQLLNNVRNDAHEKYESVINRITSQNAKLKRESANLAANLNREILDRRDYDQLIVEGGSKRGADGDEEEVDYVVTRRTSRGRDPAVERDFPVVGPREEMVGVLPISRTSRGGGSRAVVVGDRIDAARRPIRGEGSAVRTGGSARLSRTTYQEEYRPPTSGSVRGILRRSEFRPSARR